VLTRSRWSRSDTLLVVAIVVGGLLLALTLGNDYGLSWDEPLIATYVGRLLRAYASLESKDSVFVDLHYYGPLFFLIADGIGRGLREILTGWTLADGRHAASFLSYVMATLSVFVIARGVTGRWPALIGALLMATQPLLFGHAFINPKDIPFLGFFAAVVASGMLAVQAIPAEAGVAGERPSAASAESADFLTRLRTVWKRMAWPLRTLLGLGLVLGSVLLVDALFLRRITLPLLLSLTRAAVAGEAPGLVQGMFDRMTEAGRAISIEAYLHKVTGLHRRIGIFAGALILIVSLSLVSSAVLSRNKSLGRAFAWWWVVSAVLVGAATAIRVLGPMAGVLVCTLLVARLGRRSVPLIGLYWLLGAAVVYAGWPYLWGRPIAALLEAFSRAADSPWDAKVLFMGQLTRVIDLPRYFAPAILSLQLTLPALVLAPLGAVLSVVMGRRTGNLPWALVLWAWWLVPFVPSVALGSTVYDNARQLLFALPPMFALSSLAIAVLLRAARFRLARLALSLLILLPGVLAIRQLHPYEYIYYNQLVQGVNGAYRLFELDYWVTGSREAIGFVNEVAPPSATVAVAGSRAVAAYHAREDLDLWPQDDLGEPGRRPDFLIATTRWDSDLNAWPEAPVVWRLERDGALLAVVKDLRGGE
jgi:hypothetical protein